MYPNGFVNAHLSTEREKNSKINNDVLYALKTLLKFNMRHRNASWKNETDETVKKKKANVTIWRQ